MSDPIQFLALPVWVEVACAFVAMMMAFWAGVWCEHNKTRIAQWLARLTDQIEDRLRGAE